MFHFLMRLQMYKILTLFYILVLLIPAAGCGNSGSGRKQGEIYGKCHPDNTCNEGLVCDTENNVCIRGNTADGDAGNPDNTEPDEDADSEIISDEDTDEKNDTDSSENEYENWKDPKTGLIWSEKHSIPGPATVEDLISFCDDLVEGGFSDWKMPTIDELRRLIRNCSNTEPYGICSISEENGSLEFEGDDMWICDCEWKNEWTQQIGKDEFIYDNGGYYSRLGDDQDVVLCSSSLNNDIGGLWCVGFDIAFIGVVSPSRVNVVRCVGSYSRQKQCEGLPENASWNVFSSIPQTWDGSSWQPADTASYNETPSETECRFICNPGYKWNGLICNLQDFKAISECSHESPTPCYDPSSGLAWSAKAPYEMLHYDAFDYCENLSVGGLGGWRLPTISELRTLIQNCRWTVTGGDCKITDDCLSETYCEYSYSQCDNDCNRYNGDVYVIYSKFGDEGDFLSSSKVTDYPDDVWGVNFDKAQILAFGTNEVYHKASFRCVQTVK